MGAAHAKVVKSENRPICKKNDESAKKRCARILCARQAIPPPPSGGVIGLGDASRGGFAIARPICAARFDDGAAFGAIGIGTESDSCDTLQAIAATAKANKIFDNHCAAIGFRDQVAALVSVPCAARGAAIKAGEHCVADQGGDAGFLGHWLSFLAIHRPYGTPRGNASKNFTFFHFFFCLPFVHVLFRIHGLFTFCSTRSRIVTRAFISARHRLYLIHGKARTRIPTLRRPTWLPLSPSPSNRSASVTIASR